MDWFVIIVSLVIGALAGILTMSLLVAARGDRHVDDTERLNALELYGMSITNLGHSETNPNGVWAILNGTTIVGKITDDLRSSIDSALETVNA